MEGFLLAVALGELPGRCIDSRSSRLSGAADGACRRIGEDVTETLDYVPGRFKVIRHIREKLSCRICDAVVAAPAQIVRLPAAALARVFSPISSSPSMTITYRFIGRPRSSPARGLSWRPRPCPAGSVRRRQPSNR